jgi:galactonate dehydratase
MKWTRRDFFKTSLALPAGLYLSSYETLAAPFTKQVKITAVKAMRVDVIRDGCLIKIETDAGLVGYGEAGVTASMARARIAADIQGALLGQDPLAIERHFYMMTAVQHGFMAHIPTISGVDIALWDLAGKIIDKPIYKLLGGPFREAVPTYSHGSVRNMLDPAACRTWAQAIRQAPEGFTAFKFDIAGLTGPRTGPYLPTLDTLDLRKVAKGFANVREAVGDDIAIAVHCHSEFDTPSAIGIAKATEPMNPLFIEDPLNVPYSEGWMALKRSTRVPILSGEKLEMVRQFRPFLDNQALDIIHPDIAFAGGITGCKKIADYAALTRTPVALHNGQGALVRIYASAHLAGSIQNFYKLENGLGAGVIEKMAADNPPVVRQSQLRLPEGPGLGLNVNEDFLREHLPRGETYWD